MLYMDVTQSCRTPKHTGVERVVRGLYRDWTKRMPVHPICWDERWNSYCELTDEERRNLTDPFADSNGASAKPERSGWRSAWSKVRRWWGHAGKRIDLFAELGTDDVLLVTENFTDGRTKLLKHATCRRIAYFHDAIPLILAREKGMISGHPFEEFIRRLSEMNRVVCTTRTAREDLLRFSHELGLKAPDTIVENLPVDFGSDRPPHQPTPAKRTVLCVGSLNPRKNHLVLLAASRQLWAEGLDFDLQVAGRVGKDGGNQIAAELTAEAAAGRRVKWLQHVPDEALCDLYTNASFTVYPSVLEGFGLPIIESVWFGRPCICANFGAMAEVAEGGGCVTVNTNQAGELAAAMRTLLTDPSAYAARSLECRERTFRTADEYAAAVAAKVGDLFK